MTEVEGKNVKCLICVLAVMALLGVNFAYALNGAVGYNDLNVLASHWLQLTTAETAMWVSGSNAVNQNGVYGTKGVPAPTNVPGARESSISWIDGYGNLWLFGGFGYTASGSQGRLNDLWKFDGTNWTWVSGSNAVNQNGVYGTKGVPASGNVPGARSISISWIDGQGNLWLFGGYGYDASGSGFLNDLWKFDGTNWTWVSGSNTAGQYGVYGTKGVPGARGHHSISWIDGYGNLWLFGGQGYDASGSYGNLNDLWKFDGTNWTWVSGSNTVNQNGVYGTKGVPASGNVPGARESSISWIDGYGNLWLFGGDGFGASGGGFLNDLWKFDGTNWAWVSGSNTAGQYGVYGTKGVAASGNVPGAREYSISWIDGQGNLWLFGGSGYAASGSQGYLNDLWKFVYSQPAADADLNGDGFVNMRDYALFASHWLLILGDFDGDNHEDFTDYAIFAKSWMSQSGQSNWNPACDISEPKDNIIDWEDLAVFAEYWLAGIQ
jgi:hypothetical protein